MVHFLLNLGFGIYFLVVVNHTADVDVSVACHKAIKDAGAQQDCSKLLNGFRGALDGVIIFVLLIELCTFVHKNLLIGTYTEWTILQMVCSSSRDT